MTLFRVEIFIKAFADYIGKMLRMGLCLLVVDIAMTWEENFGQKVLLGRMKNKVL